jgi:hypothetical protein
VKLLSTPLPKNPYPWTCNLDSAVFTSGGRRFRLQPEDPDCGHEGSYLVAVPLPDEPAPLLIPPPRRLAVNLRELRTRAPRRAWAPVPRRPVPAGRLRRG